MSAVLFTVVPLASLLAALASGSPAATCQGTPPSHGSDEQQLLQIRRGAAPATSSRQLLQPLSFHLPPGASCEVVTSRALVDTKGFQYLPGLVPPECSIVLYDKSPAQCKTNVPESPRLRCQTLEDSVHAWEYTFLYHVAANYKNLPDVLIALPAEILHHNRYKQLRHALQQQSFGSHGHSFACISDVPKGTVPEFPKASFPVHPLIDNFPDEQLIYAGKWDKLVPSDPHPFGPWLLKFMRLSNSSGRFNDTDENIRNGLACTKQCHFSAFATTSSNLRAHPQSMYAAAVAMLADAVKAAATAGAAGSLGPKKPPMMALSQRLALRRSQRRPVGRRLWRSTMRPLLPSTKRPRRLEEWWFLEWASEALFGGGAHCPWEPAASAKA